MYNLEIDSGSRRQSWTIDNGWKGSFQVKCKLSILTSDAISSEDTMMCVVSRPTFSATSPSKVKQSRKDVLVRKFNNVHEITSKLRPIHSTHAVPLQNK